MRPKVVLLTLVAAFAVLGIVAALRGVMGGHSGNTNGVSPVTEATVNSQATNTNDQVPPASLNSSNNSEQWRAVVIQSELDAIQKLVSDVDGTNNPMIISALVGNVANPEEEVRKAALAALVQLNDTNAVPELKKLADDLKDPRTKVAVMDTIDYLNLPDAFPAVQPPESFTNNPVNHISPNNMKMNPKFLHTNSAPVRIIDGGQQTPAPTGQTQ